MGTGGPHLCGQAMMRHTVGGYRLGRPGHRREGASASGRQHRQDSQRQHSIGEQGEAAGEEGPGGFSPCRDLAEADRGRHGPGYLQASTHQQRYEGQQEGSPVAVADADGERGQPARMGSQPGAHHKAVSEGDAAPC
jgi:hypothetical protein